MDFSGLIFKEECLGVWDYNIRIYNAGNMRNKELKKTGQIASTVFVV